jgi:hypothetical protein
MLTRAGEAIAAALMKAITIVLLGLLLYALYHWAIAHPEQAQVLFNKAMTTLFALVNKVLDGLAGLAGS